MSCLASCPRLIWSTVGVSPNCADHVTVTDYRFKDSSFQLREYLAAKRCGSLQTLEQTTPFERTASAWQVQWNYPRHAPLDQPVGPPERFRFWGHCGRLEPPQHEVQNEKPNSETLIIIRIKARAERLNRYLGVIYWSRQIYPRDYYVQKNCINERRINIEPWLSLRR